MLMSSGDKSAKLAYGPNGFRVIRPGNYVYCAVTGQEVPLEEATEFDCDQTRLRSPRETKGVNFKLTTCCGDEGCC